MVRTRRILQKDQQYSGLKALYKLPRQHSNGICGMNAKRLSLCPQSHLAALTQMQGTNLLPLNAAGETQLHGMDEVPPTFKWL